MTDELMPDYAAYEKDKRILREEALSPAEYERKIKELVEIYQL